jgi:hypothetical protein
MNQLQSFKVLPKFIGTWQGEWIALNLRGEKLYSFTSLLTQKIDSDRWVQTNEHTYDDGRRETIHFFGEVIEENILLLSSPEFPYCDFTMLISELEDNLIIIRVFHTKTGIPLTVETINLIAPNERLRTLQQFNTTDGKLRGFTLVSEKKID